MLYPAARAAITDPANELLLSAATLWEISIKVRLKKLTLAVPYRQWIDRAVSDLRLIILPIEIAHAEVQIGLPDHHRDPFDRLLAAQSIVENVPIVSIDSVFDRYGVRRIWQ